MSSVSTSSIALAFGRDNNHQLGGKPTTAEAPKAWVEAESLSASTQSNTLELEEHDQLGDRGAADPFPKADGGKESWLFLVGCFFFEALVWGFPFSFGVFETEYTAHPPFSNSPSGIAIIGTCATGVMYLFAPVSLHVLSSYPKVRRLSSIAGLIICVSALVASSFATRVWQLILTQGILYAIGGSLLYAPTNLYLDEWFIKKKGFAIGVMWSGAGFSGLIFPFLLTWLIQPWGISTALRIWAMILLLTSLPLIYFVRPRLPAQAHHESVNYSFLKTRTFWFLQAANVAEGLGYFMPSIYLPTYARSLSLSINGSSSLSGQVLLSLINTSSAISAPLFGFLCDRLSVYTVISLSSLGSTLSIFLLWFLSPLPSTNSASLAILIVFAITYGVFAGGWSSIWSGMIKEVQRVHTNAKMGALMGLFSAGRGIGAVCSGPISSALLKGNTKRFSLGSSGGFGNVVLFTGITAFCGFLALVGRTERKVENEDSDARGAEEE